MISKSQFRQRVRRMADADNSGRWDDTTEVDPIIASVFDTEWRRILAVDPYRRASLRTPTTDTQGRIPVSALSDTGQRFYRIISFHVNDIAYQIGNPRDWLGGVDNSQDVGPYVWWRIGDYLYTRPAKVNTQASIWVNHIPSSYDTLGEDDNIVYPDGYELIPVYEAAGLLLSKGGAETGATVEMLNLATRMREEMLQDLVRYSVHPIRPILSDNPWEWGG